MRAQGHYCDIQNSTALVKRLSAARADRKQLSRSPPPVIEAQTSLKNSESSC